MEDFANEENTLELYFWNNEHIFWMKYKQFFFSKLTLYNYFINEVSI